MDLYGYLFFANLFDVIHPCTIWTSQIEFFQPAPWMKEPTSPWTMPDSFFEVRSTPIAMVDTDSIHHLNRHLFFECFDVAEEGTWHD